MERKLKMKVEKIKINWQVIQYKKLINLEPE